MLDTVRLSFNDFFFYKAVVDWRQDDLGGTIPARINADVLRSMMEDGKIIDLELFKERKIRDVLDHLNEHGLNVVIKDFFQVHNLGSWCRDITCIIDEYNHRILIEFSLPKFVNGQNVDLLYNYRAGLLDFIGFIYQYFRCPLPDEKTLMAIELSRIDFCYYYKYPSQIHANDFIRSFKSWCNHKRKKIHYYDTSVMFVGRSYSLKFYMKYNEFQTHDKREIQKNITMILDSQYKDSSKTIKDYNDMINYCDAFSTGMVRCEFSVRKQKLNYDNLYTIKDLLELDVIDYYEGLLDRMGVLKMGHTQKDEYFNQLKSDKKLLYYCSLLETFGKDKVKELYCRQTVSKYDKMLRDLSIQMGDFDLLKDIDLHVRDFDRQMVHATSDEYHQAMCFVGNKLF
jgi:hypothetical protein